MLRSGCPEGHFGRNQLSPVSIGFSPLTPGHPRDLSLTTGIGPPGSFHLPSPYPGLARPVSGRRRVIPGPFRPSTTLARASYVHFAFATVSRLKPLNLTTHLHSLARSSKRTARPCKLSLVLANAFLRDSTFQALPDYGYLVSGSFHLPFGMLFSFHSHY